MSKSFKKKSREKREAKRARNRAALLGTRVDETASAGPASAILKGALEDAADDWEEFAWDVPRPEGVRVVTVDDLAAYCDTLTMEQFASSFRAPESFATDDPDLEMKNYLEPLAKAAASRGFGEIYAPFSIDAIKLPKKVMEGVRAVGDKAIGGVTDVVGEKLKRFDRFAPPPKAAAVERVAVRVTQNRGLPPSEELQHPKTCRTCGKEFSTAFGTVVYCSEGCRKEALRAPGGTQAPELTRGIGTRGETAPATRHCEVCGKELPPGAPKVKRFCSENCHDVYFSTHVRPVTAAPTPRPCPGCATLLADTVVPGRCPVCGARLS